MNIPKKDSDIFLKSRPSTKFIYMILFMLMEESVNNPSETSQQQTPPPAQIATSDLSTEIQNANQLLTNIKNTYKQLIIGQDELLESIIVTLLSNGHLLIEGLPGLAKTTAAHTIAKSIGADFARIQCTPDMLPADIVGSQIFNQQTYQFSTQLGPINHQFLLIDEINRTGAKTQSALLEAMQERQVSIGGKTHDLPPGFIVMATQNPIEQEGTYPLPEAQLDRFLLKHIVQYPTYEEEIAIMKIRPSNDAIAELQASASVSDILNLQKLASKIGTDERVIRYIASIVGATREPEKFGLETVKPFIQVGASPRASLALLACGRVSALMSQSAYVTPDHIKPFMRRVLRHRLILSFEAEAENISADAIIDQIASVIQVP